MSADDDNDPLWYAAYVEDLETLDGGSLKFVGMRNENISWHDKYPTYHPYMLNRDNDLPAIIFKDGEQGWYCHGKKHRDHGLPAVIWANGTSLKWFINDKQIGDQDNPPPGAVFPGQLTKPARSQGSETV